MISEQRFDDMIASPDEALPRRNARRFFILFNDWTWWAWTVTAILLTLGLIAYPAAFIVAMALTGVQAIVMLIREKKLSAFPVQLRVAYLGLLCISFIPQMRWLYWLPALGTFALVLFGYCLLARVLSLLPWNRHEALSSNLLLRTFLSRPDLSRLANNPRISSCPGGLCTIAAQVSPGQTK